jgi:hypothetical protein
MTCPTLGKAGSVERAFSQASDSFFDMSLNENGAVYYLEIN